MMKNGKDFDKQAPRAKIKAVTWLGLLANIALSIAKAVAGLLANSQALLADAFHSLSDIGSDVAILVGERYWTAPADSNHPYGHYRIEALISMSIGAILIAAGLSLGYEALDNLSRQSTLAPSWPAFAIALLAIVTKEALCRYTLIAAAHIHSSALRANAIHHRADALSSIPVAFALLIASVFPGWAFIDRIGAFVVSLFLLHAGWKILRPAIEELADRGACQNTREWILQTARSINGVQDVHGLRSRRCGPGIFVDLHVLVDPSISVREGHAIAGLVKKRLCRDGHGAILDALVHIEPCEQQN